VTGPPPPSDALAGLAARAASSVASPAMTMQYLQLRDLPPTARVTACTP
jgi:hypothetical protein